MTVLLYATGAQSKVLLSDWYLGLLYISQVSDCPVLERKLACLHTNTSTDNKSWRAGLSLSLAPNPTWWHIIKLMDVVCVGPKVHVGNTSNIITMETSAGGDKDTGKIRKKVTLQNESHLMSTRVWDAFHNILEMKLSTQPGLSGKKPRSSYKCPYISI